MDYKFAWIPKKVETWRRDPQKYWVWLQEYKVRCRTDYISGNEYPYNFVTRFDGIHWKCDKFRRIKILIKHLKK
jgi:hypothetical protein